MLYNDGRSTDCCTPAKRMIHLAKEGGSGREGGEFKKDSNEDFRHTARHTLHSCFLVWSWCCVMFTTTTTSRRCSRAAAAVARRVPLSYIRQLLLAVASIEPYFVCSAAVAVYFVYTWYLQARKRNTLVSIFKQ